MKEPARIGRVEKQVLFRVFRQQMLKARKPEAIATLFLDDARKQVGAQFKALSDEEIRAMISDDYESLAALLGRRIPGAKMPPLPPTNRAEFIERQIQSTAECMARRALTSRSTRSHAYSRLWGKGLIDENGLTEAGKQILKKFVNEFDLMW